MLEGSLYVLSPAQPVTLESLGARFEEWAHGEGRLRWRPRTRDAGLCIFTFAGKTPDGLVTRESFRVEVKAEDRRERRRRRRGRRGDEQR